ncbi:uncharacterized protein LOC116245839 [Nymphaea colorata]|nr:uncharacterized protein LOC116245839 [Nymphaea colorata]
MRPFVTRDGGRRNPNCLMAPSHLPSRSSSPIPSPPSMDPSFRPSTTSTTSTRRVSLLLPKSGSSPLAPSSLSPPTPPHFPTSPPPPPVPLPPPPPRPPFHPHRHHHHQDHLLFQPFFPCLLSPFHIAKMWLDTPPCLDSPSSPQPTPSPFDAFLTLPTNDHFPFPSPDYSNYLHPLMDTTITGGVPEQPPDPNLSSHYLGGGDEKGGGDGGEGGGVGNSWSFGLSITRAARSKRRIARKNSPSFSRFIRSSKSPSWKAGKTKKKEANGTKKRHLVLQDHSFNKNLKLLLQKELKNSDVSSLGRVIIPKKEAEANLPSLADKEGIRIKFKDMESSQAWNLRYRFWPNNKSRMYVLENTGDFVRKYHLHSGDFILLFRDEETQQFFISARKSEESMPSSQDWIDEDLSAEQSDQLVLSDASSDHDQNVGERTVATEGNSSKGDVGLKLVREPSSEFGGEDGAEFSDDMFGSCSSIMSSMSELYDWNFSSLEKFDSFEDIDLSLYNETVDMDDFDAKKLG